MSTPPPDPFADIPPVGSPPEPEASGSTRSGGARERQQRRKQHAQPSSPRSAPKQTAPGNRIRLPRIQWASYRIWFTLLLVVVVIGGVVFVLGRLRPTERVAADNAIWAGTNWTYDAPDDQAVAAFAQQLKDHGIGTVYAWVSWLQEDGTWRGSTNFPNVRRFVEQFRAAYPEATLYGWVSLPVDGGADGYRLDDEGVQQAVADFSQRVVNDFGFDGVFLNVEPVWDGDENFLSLVRGVRAAVGIDTLISVAVPPDWSPANASIPVPPLIVPGTEWSPEFKQSLALLSDEIAVMAYNSGLSSPDDYAQWVAYQVSTWAQALSALGEGTEIVVGMPTYDAEPPGHDPLVENVTSAEIGYELGLEQSGADAPFVRGRALYADWTTDAQEWAAFRQAIAQ
jgi:hypothetical protein